MADFSRRSMIRTAALVPLAAKVGCARSISTNRFVAVPAAVDGDVTIALATAPELSRPGGAIVAKPQGSAGAYLVANSGTGYLALAAECPHAGCDVAWVPEDRQAECPCHGSRFAGDGTLLNPPARSDLAHFPAELDGQGNVVVHLFAGDGTFKDRVRNGQFSFAITDVRALANPGGAILGRPTGFPNPLIVVRLSVTGPDQIAALAAICPHLGCTVLPGVGLLQCPCHDSRFDLSGKFMQGPAGTNLPRHAVKFDGTIVTVFTAFSV